MAGLVFHIMNRSAKRGPLLETPDDYEAFIDTVREAQTQRPLRLLDFCAMSTHFHMVAWPEADRDLPRFMHWLTTTFSLRWRKDRKTVGEGAVFQSRYKAVAVQQDDHFLQVCRYVERNPVRAGLVARVEDWRWGGPALRWSGRLHFDPWPVAPPARWLDYVNSAQTQTELDAMRRAVNRSCPIGEEVWQREVAATLGITRAIRRRGRPPARTCGQPG
ncbi:MAG: transposase [Acidobacteriota bacterium]